MATQVRGNSVVVRLSGNDEGLAKMLQEVMKHSNTLAKSFATVDVQAKQTAIALRTQANAALSLAQAQARLAVAQGRPAQAAQILQTALQGVNQQTPQAVNAMTQLARVQNIASQSAVSFGNNLQKLTSQIGFFGGLFIGQQVLGFAADLIKAGTDLEKSEAFLRALTRSQEEYNDVLGLAKSQQQLFGGSLSDNIRSLGTFINLSQRTGVELRQIENIARRLALVDPLQGFSGAAIALKELESGEVISLVRRFELPRSLITQIKNIDNQVDRFNALDKALTDIGYGQRLLTEQTETTAIVYDRLAASFDNAKASIGGYIAELLKVPAAQTAAELQWVADNVDGAQTLEPRRDQTLINLLSQAKDVAAFNAEVERANTIINNTSVAVGLLGGYFNELNASTFEAAKTALSYGKNQQFVASTLNQIAPLNEQFGQALIDQVSMMGLSADAANKLQQDLLKLAFSSDAGRIQAINLFNAFLDGRINAEELRIALDNIAASNVVLAGKAAEAGLELQRQEERTLGVVDATEDATDSINVQIAAIAEEITKRSTANAEAAKTKAIQEELARLAKLVADGTYTLEAAVGLLGDKFNLTSEQAALFAQALGIVASQVDLTAGKMSELGRVTGSALSVLNQFNGRNPDLTSSSKKPGSPGSFYSAPTKDKDKTGKSPSLTAQEKLNNQLEANSDKFYDKVEKAFLDHNQKLLDIQRDFSAKQVEAQRASEVSKRQGKADFYAKLIETTGIDQSEFSAAFEAAYAESQRIAQEGNRQLAQDYLALRQKQIDADIEYAKKRAEIENSDLSSGDKRVKLQLLASVNQMQQEAAAEELKQLLEGGDSIQNELQDKLAEESQRYADQLEDIGLTSSQLADLRIANWERANKTIAGMPAAELLNFGAAPQTQGQTPQQIKDVVTVKDTDLIGSVVNLGDRLSGKLDEVRSAIDSTQQALSQKLGSVENAVRSIRPKLVT
jgi:hypothetical protein